MSEIHMVPISSSDFLPIPNLPKCCGHIADLATVRFLDKVRFSVFDDDAMWEFYWFTREYPRMYRHHISNVDHRLRCIRSRYEEFRERTIAAEAASAWEGSFIEAAEGGTRTLPIYWDFEAVLNAAGAALDLLARIVGTAFRNQTPINFNKFRRHPLVAGDPLGVMFQAAFDQWVSRLKNYRDCFIHYTPIDSMLSIACRRYANGIETRCRIPTNPNARESIDFRYSRKTELLRYSIDVRKKLDLFDRQVAAELERRWVEGTWPVRTSNLFGVAGR